MAITIGRIADKFWDNSSYKQPNTFPIYEKQITLDRVKPSINSFISGDIYLEGGDWNHCIYEGVYYALHIIRALDVKKNRYHYRLEREFWFDVLKLGAIIRGDLSISSDEKLLEANIHKTIGILDNPTKVTTINFKVNAKRTSFDSVEITLPKLRIRDKVIIKQAFENFLSKLNVEYNWEKLNKEFFEGARNPSIYILGKLDTQTVSIEGWRQKVVNKVTEFLNTLKDNKDNLKISKVTSLASSKLQGNYCITYRGEGAIGTSDEPYEIAEIDLSGLKEVKAVNIDTLEESVPTTPIDLNAGESGGLFDDPAWLAKESVDFLGKIARIPHTPVGHVPEADFRLPNMGTSFTHPEINWKGTKPLQKITWAYKDKRGTAYLWWVDYMNGIFWNQVYPKGTGTYNISFSYTATVVGGSYGGAATSNVAPYWVDKAEFEKEFADVFTHIPYSIPKISIEGEKYGDPFASVETERVGLGFLLFQVYRNPDNWDLFEYKSSGKLTAISYISGISKSFFHYYEQRTKHWFNLSDHYGKETKLANLQPKGSEVFVRCTLDNDWLAWLAFLPQYAVNYAWGDTDPDEVAAGNYYNDEYGIYYYRAYQDFAYLQIRTDIRDVNGKVIQFSPYRTPQHYKQFKTERKNNLNSKLIWSNIAFESFEETSKDFVIEEGDYFFSDLDYTIKRYENGLKFPDLTQYIWTYKEQKGFTAQRTERVKARALTSLLYSEDYIMPLPEKEAEPGIYICTRKDGKLDLRFLHKATTTLQLSREEEQTVDSVDGRQERKTTFYLMKKGYVFDSDVEISDLDKKNILRDIYKFLGYPVSPRIGFQDNPRPTWLWYSSEDLEKKQLLFDLIGTNWYCLISKGKVNLISKSLRGFKGKGGKAEYLDHEQNKKYISVKDDKQSPTLLERINQKVQFRFLTSSYDLNWKTNFNDSDSLSLVYEPAKANEKERTSDYYYLWLDSKHDIIWWEVIKIAKLLTDKAEKLASGTEIEKLHVDILNSQRLFEANQGRYQLASKRLNENIRRSQVQLDIQKRSADLNFATGLLKSLIGGSYHIGDQVTSILENAKGFHDEKRVTMDWQMKPIWANTAELGYPGNQNLPVVGVGAGGVMQQLIGWEKVGIPTVGNQGVRNGISATSIANSTLGYINNFGLSQANLIGQYIIQRGYGMAEKQRMIDADQKLGAEQLALQSLAMNTSFMSEQLQKQLELNRIFSRYDVPLLADSALDDEYRKNTEIHGKELGKAHLVVYTPSAEQMKYIEEYAEEYGVQCDIPDVEIQIYPGMPSGIFCYRNLEDNGIEGVTNTTIRQYLKTRATVGVKVVEIGTPSDVHALMDSERYKKYLNICHVLNEDRRAELENIYRVKLEEAKKQVDIEAQKRTETIQQQLNECNTQIAEVNKQLEAKVNEINDLKGKCDLNKIRQEIDALKRESETRKEKVEELTQQLNDERRKFLDERDKINALTKQLKDKTAELDACKQDKSSVTTSSTSLEDCQAVKELFAQPTEFNLIVDDEKGWNPVMWFILEFLRRLEDEPTDAASSEAFREIFAQIIQFMATFKEPQFEKINKLFDPELEKMLISWYSLFPTTLIAWFGDEIYKDKSKFNNYMEWLWTGKEEYRDSALIDKMYKWKQMMSYSRFLELKNAWDEANYAAYITMKALNEKIGQSQKLQELFSKVFPSNFNEHYKKIFGDPNIGIARKRFMDEIECGEQGNKSIAQIAKEIKESTDIDKVVNSLGLQMPRLKFLPPIAWPKPPEQPVSHFARSIEQAKYSGVLLDNIEIRYPYANPLFAFEDRKITQNLENVNYRWSHDGYSMNDKPKITMAMQMFNYPYTKKANKWKELAKCVWFKWKSQGANKTDSTNKSQFGNYLKIDDLKQWEMKAQFNFLIDSINRINIPASMVEGLKNGSRNLRLRHGTFRLRRDYIDGKPMCYAEGIANVNELIEFGNGNNQLHWPEDKIADFLKYIFIFHYLHVRPLYHDKLSSDQFHIYSFDVGAYHPARTTLRNQDLLNKINSEISKITDKTIDLQIGWLFNSWGDRLREDGDIPVPEGTPIDQRTATYLTLYRWIYGHITGKKKYLHPYDWGQNNIYMLLFRLKEADKAKKNKRDADPALDVGEKRLN